MAGKSTFLRTVAVNFILGMTGAPVCASDMSFMPGKRLQVCAPWTHSLKMNHISMLNLKDLVI